MEFPFEALVLGPGDVLAATLHYLRPIPHVEQSLGRVRQAIGRLACGECGAAIYTPCVNKRTKREIKGFHSSRRFAGRNDVLNRQVGEIERETEAAHFFMYAWLVFGGRESNYPEKSEPSSWAALYQEHPDYDPGQRYWGEF